MNRGVVAVFVLCHHDEFWRGGPRKMCACFHNLFTSLFIVFTVKLELHHGLMAPDCDGERPWRPGFAHAVTKSCRLIQENVAALGFAVVFAWFYHWHQNFDELLPECHPCIKTKQRLLLINKP